MKKKNISENIFWVFKICSVTMKDFWENAPPYCVLYGPSNSQVLSYPRISWSKDTCWFPVPSSWSGGWPRCFFQHPVPDPRLVTCLVSRHTTHCPCDSVLSTASPRSRTSPHRRCVLPFKNYRSPSMTKPKFPTILILSRTPSVIRVICSLLHPLSVKWTQGYTRSVTSIPFSFRSCLKTTRIGPPVT